jgi:hypothetical protein
VWGDPNRAAFEERLSREVRRFELKPLVDLLIAKGYERDELLFEGTHERSSSSLVSAIQFREAPARCVLITVNLGLLGDNTLLPSYFLRAVEASPDPGRFFDFIRFFDHRLIDNLIRAVYPDDTGGAYHDWRRVLRSFFGMLGVGSVATLHWLVQLHFPELRVHVTRQAVPNTTVSHALRTGMSKLDGTSVLGRVYASEATGFCVELFAEEEVDARGRAWPEIVQERLEQQLLPLLAPFRLPLVVRLKVLYHASWAMVASPPDGVRGYLGYERVRGDAESGHTTLIYRGVTGGPAELLRG